MPKPVRRLVTVTPRARSRFRFWLVLLAAGAIRLAGIERASFFHYDEGEVARCATGPAVAARWAVRQTWNGEPFTASSLREEYVRHGFPYARTSARPGHLALVALSMTIFGVSDTASILLSAAAGIGTVALVFLTLRTAVPEREEIPVWGALILAFSPDHVFFSRTGYSHIAAGFFLAWAVFLHVRDRLRPFSVHAFGTGLAAGYAFTCHFNVAWILAAFFLADAWETTSGKGGERLRPWLARWSRIACGMVVPPLVFQGATLAARAAFPAWLPDQTTYLADLRAQWSHLFHYCNPHAVSTPLFYAIHWIRTEGVGPFAAAVAGSVLAFRGAGKSATERGFFRMAALFVWVSFGSMSWMSWKVARTLVPVFPFAAALAGLAIGGWRPASPAGRWLRVAVLLGGLAQPVWTSLSYLEGHGHFRETVRALEGKGRQVLVVDELPVVDFYIGGKYQVMVGDWAEYERIQAALPARRTLIALHKDGEYGFQDPVYWNRFGFVREVASRMPPGVRAPFGVPLAYEYVDRSFRWDRFLSLSGVRYEVHLFDLEELPR